MNNLYIKLQQGLKAYLHLPSRAFTGCIATSTARYPPWPSLQSELQHEIMCYHLSCSKRRQIYANMPSSMMFHRRFEALNCKFSFHEYRSRIHLPTKLLLLGVRTTHCLSMMAPIYALPALWAHDEQHMLHPQLHDACKLEGYLPSISSWPWLPSLPSPPSLPLAFL